MTKKQKVLANIVTLIVCVIGLALSLCYMVAGLLGYFIEPDIETTGSLTECMLDIAMFLLCMFCGFLITHPIRNLFGEVKRNIRRKKHEQ